MAALSWTVSVTVLQGLEPWQEARTGKATQRRAECGAGSCQGGHPSRGRGCRPHRSEHHPHWAAPCGGSSPVLLFLKGRPKPLPLHRPQVRDFRSPHASAPWKFLLFQLRVDGKCHSVSTPQVLLRKGAREHCFHATVKPSWEDQGLTDFTKFLRQFSTSSE